MKPEVGEGKSQTDSEVNEGEHTVEIGRQPSSPADPYSKIGDQISGGENEEDRKPVCEE